MINFTACVVHILFIVNHAVIKCIYAQTAEKVEIITPTGDAGLYLNGYHAHGKSTGKDSAGL